MALLHSSTPDAEMSELPNEVLYLIVQMCPRATLKNLRLASKSVAQMVDPTLWRKVVLVPNDCCILGFIDALGRSKAIAHVQKLVYDARFSSFFTMIKSHKPDLDIEWPKDDKAKLERLMDRAAQGRFGPFEDMAVEVAILAKALRMLPQLQEVVIREDDEPGAITGSDRVPYFYHKLCRAIMVNPEKVAFNEMTTTCTRSYTKGMLTAAFSAGCRLKSFKSTGIEGRSMFSVQIVKSAAANQQLGIIQAVIENLSTLELSFRDETLVPSAHHIDSIQTLLSTATRLKSLRLRLTDYSSSRFVFGDDEMASEIGGLLETTTGTWMSRPLLPKLESLAIDACLCHEEDLIHFLRLHSSTLRRLELANITLLGADDRRECWVRVLKSIQKNLRLTSASFTGWFTNGGRQQWFVAKDSVGSERLKAKIERFVVDRNIRVCPLERVAVKPGQSDVEKPKNGEEWEGDLSWAMVYINRDGTHTEWQLAPPVFSAPSPAAATSTPHSEVIEQPNASDPDIVMSEATFGGAGEWYYTGTPPSSKPGISTTGVAIQLDNKSSITPSSSSIPQPSQSSFNKKMKKKKKTHHSHYGHMMPVPPNPFTSTSSSSPSPTPVWQFGGSAFQTPPPLLPSSSVNWPISPFLMSTSSSSSSSPSLLGSANASTSTSTSTATSVPATSFGYGQPSPMQTW